MEGKAGAGDYIASLLSSSPRLDLGALGAGGEEEEEDDLPGQVLRRPGVRGGAAVQLRRAALRRPLRAASAGSREASSVSDPTSATKDVNARKRKAPAAAAKGEGEESAVQAEAGEQKVPDAKRCKTEGGEEGGPDRKPKPEQAGSDSSVEDGGQSQKPEPPGKGKDATPAEAPKDYVHVRARRGQATDSHSLAERVRRERIGQRMKVLQDLVPGCNKVIGKALMLDEIINYVQSLQRQVEFLSMKLATVNPLDLGDLPAYSPPAERHVPSSGLFPFGDHGDVFQSFVPTGLEESQCGGLNPLDLALSQATNGQYGFQDGTDGTNMQILSEENVGGTVGAERRAYAWHARNSTSSSAVPALHVPSPTTAKGWPGGGLATLANGDGLVIWRAGSAACFECM